MKQTSSWASFGGKLTVHEHASDVCQCPMTFAVYTPPQASQGPVPVLWYLSGLTCDWSKHCRMNQYIVGFSAGRGVPR